MADLATNRNTDRREPNIGKVDIAAAKIAYTGLLCLLNLAKNYDPASANAVSCCGVVISPTSDMDYDNSGGAAGDQQVRYEFDKQAYFDKDATHTPTSAYVSFPGYASDNHTISYDPEDGVEVGTIMEVDDNGVWVLCERHPGVTGNRNYALNAATQTLLLATELVFSTGLKYFPVVGSPGDVVLTADLPDGDYVGREIMIIGTNDAAKVSVSHGLNTVLRGGLLAELGQNDLIMLGWNGSNWVELYRSIG